MPKQRKLATEDLWVQIDGVRRLAARAGQPIPPEYLPYVDDEATTPEGEAPPALDGHDAGGTLDAGALREVLEEAPDDDLVLLAAAVQSEISDRGLGGVEVPDGVVPGETPGWPIDADSGEPLDLPDQVREELAEVSLKPPDERRDLDGMSLEELKAEAKRREVGFPSRATKAKMLELLRDGGE